MSERTQSVKIGDETSEPIRLARGVPQGSVLGPSLLSLYVAPIEDIIKSYGLNCAVYADGTQPYVYRLKNLFYRAVFLIFRNALRLSLNGWQITS